MSHVRDDFISEAARIVDSNLELNDKKLLVWDKLLKEINELEREKEQKANPDVPAYTLASSGCTEFLFRRLETQQQRINIIYRQLAICHYLTGELYRQDNCIVICELYMQKALQYYAMISPAAHAEEMDFIRAVLASIEQTKAPVQKSDLQQLADTTNNPEASVSPSPQATEKTSAAKQETNTLSLAKPRSYFWPVVGVVALGAAVAAVIYAPKNNS
jgi:hypothetical protein